MFPPVLATPPAATLISVADIKAQCRIENDDEDGVIAGLAEAVSSYLDGRSGVLGRALMPQTWQQDMSGFADALPLPVFPVISVAQVQYYDAANSQQTLGVGVYRLLQTAPPAVVLGFDQSWPATYDRPDAVRIAWTAGYDAVPKAIRQAALLLAGNWYENREAADAVPGAVFSELPFGVRALLTPFRAVGC